MVDLNISVDKVKVLHNKRYPCFLIWKMAVQEVPLMHQSFVSTAPPPTGMGGESDPSLFRALV